MSDNNLKTRLDITSAKGFTLIELVISIGLFAIIAVGFTTGIAMIIKYVSPTQNKEIAIRNVDTAGTWFVKDFQVANEVTANDLTPGNGKNITLIQSIKKYNDTKIVYSVDAQGNLIRQTTNIATGSITSFTIGTGFTLVHYSGSNNSVNQISITSVVQGSTPITDTYNVETRIANLGFFILNSYLPDAFVGVNYDQDVQVMGGIEPYTWTISAGSFPSWASLDSSTGNVSGIPSTTSGAVSFTVKVTDSTGAAATKNLSITVVLLL